MTPSQSRQVLEYVRGLSDDYADWAESCVWFKGKDGQPFQHNSPHSGQLLLRRPLPTGKRIRVVLKARQCGSTSEIAAQFVHLAQFNPGTSILVLAQTEKGVLGTSSVYAHVVEHQPELLRTGVFKATVLAHSITWPALNSEIVFYTANTVSVRGIPRQGVHVTEAAFVEDLDKTLTAIRPTCHGPMILESTANGPNDFHRVWNDPHLDKVFISWMDDATCVSSLPIPDDLTSQEQAYIKKNKLSKKQTAWFVYKLRECGWEAFRQEHPVTPEEAFVLGGDRFFRKGYFPPDTARIPALEVHSQPKRGRRYAIGADCASGSQKGDRSAAVVLDVTDPFNIRVAASFAARVTPSEFAKELAKLARMYFSAIVCVERNAGYGLTVLDLLRRDSISLYHTRVFDSQVNSHRDVYGWDTNATTRPLLLSRLQAAINDDMLVVNDARVQEECNAFRYNEKGDRAEALTGCHDDLIFAIALALVAGDQAKDSNLYEEPVKFPGLDAGFEAIAQYEMKTGRLAEELEDEDSD